ncbi:dihydrolipoyl dehydrogenase family protein [Companilactobacillus sp. DQM5]|uniref:dihydrolipoyl dehydrogenase family protein n=1 Tax=Companilactobacillus sp. DQM5 TaxID=3463359 RepID=UPI0040586181
MNKKYETIIIGSGPGGLASAYALNQKQAVLVVENNLWGGTCPNYGCDPKKMLYSAIQAKNQSKNLNGFGLDSTPKIIWKDLMKFKSSYTNKIPIETKNSLTSNNIDTVYGEASFISKNSISVNNEIYTADNFIIATGQSPIIPDIPGKEYFNTSTDFLSFENLPSKIAFVGAGYVSIELANIAAESGAEVHIIQHNDKILRDFPESYSKKIISDLENKGIIFHFNTSVTELTNDTILGTDNLNLKVNKTISALGRRPNIDNLNLEIAGVDFDKKGILTNEFLQTTNDNIYAIGDVLSKTVPKLTPVATFEGSYVANHILGDQKAVSYPKIPQTAFVNKEISKFGISIEEAKKNPDQYEIIDQDVTNWYSFNRIKESDARVTTIFEKNIFVGAVVYSSISDEIINYLTFISDHNIDKEQLSRMIFSYPSPASDLKYYF